MTEISFKDLPLYSYDYDANYPAIATEFKNAIAAVEAVLFVTPEYQPFDSGWLEECHRLGEPALREKLVCAKACCRHRHLTGEDWDRDRTAALAQHPRVLQFTANEFCGGLHPIRARSDHGRWPGHDSVDRGFPSKLYAGVRGLHRARLYCVAADSVAWARCRQSCSSSVAGYQLTRMSMRQGDEHPSPVSNVRPGSTSRWRFESKHDVSDGGRDDRLGGEGRDRHGRRLRPR